MEDELQRLILDIHDGAVQKLYAAASHLALLQAQLSDAPSELGANLEPVLQRSTLLVESALQDIRSTLNTFRKSEFQNRSLSEVLLSLTQQHTLLTGSHVDFQVEGSIPPVSLAIKIALYRILQEGLSNTYRHARVDQSTVCLYSRDTMVFLEIVDHGRGFEAQLSDASAATDAGEHMELSGIRERIQLVDGQLQVFSQHGLGTRLIIQVPYDA